MFFILSFHDQGVMGLRAQSRMSPSGVLHAKSGVLWGFFVVFCHVFFVGHMGLDYYLQLEQISINFVGLFLKKHCQTQKQEGFLQISVFFHLFPYFYLFFTLLPLKEVFQLIKTFAHC